jgi:hypothetical protein
VVVGFCLGMVLLGLRVEAVLVLAGSPQNLSVVG